MNRIFSNVDDIEGTHKKVLCVCSAGILRSATMAWVFAHEPYGFNCRAVGTKDYALIPVSHALVDWCEEIVCAKAHHAQDIKDNFSVGNRKVIILDISDNYNYRDPQLVKLIKMRYHARKDG